MSDTIVLKLTDEAVLTVFKSASDGIALKAGDCELKITSSGIEMTNGANSLKISAGDIKINGTSVDINNGALKVI
jgi:hypothetical protein